MLRPRTLLAEIPLPYAGQVKLVPAFTLTDYVERVTDQLLHDDAAPDGLEDLRVVAAAQTHVEGDLSRPAMFGLNPQVWAQQVPALMQQGDYERTAEGLRDLLRQGLLPASALIARQEAPEVLGAPGHGVLCRQWAVALIVLAKLFKVRCPYFALCSVAICALTALDRAGALRSGERSSRLFRACAHTAAHVLLHSSLQGPHLLPSRSFVTDAHSLPERPPVAPHRARSDHAVRPLVKPPENRQTLALPRVVPWHVRESRMREGQSVTRAEHTLRRPTQAHAPRPLSSSSGRMV